MRNKYVANYLLNRDGNYYFQNLTNIIKFILTEL